MIPKSKYSKKERLRRIREIFNEGGEFEVNHNMTPDGMTKEQQDKFLKNPKALFDLVPDRRPEGEEK